MLDKQALCISLIWKQKNNYHCCRRKEYGKQHTVPPFRPVHPAHSGTSHQRPHQSVPHFCWMVVFPHNVTLSCQHTAQSAHVWRGRHPYLNGLHRLCTKRAFVPGIASKHSHVSTPIQLYLCLSVIPLYIAFEISTSREKIVYLLN